MPSKTTIVGCLLLSSLILGIQGLSWKYPNNEANQLLLRHPIPPLTAVQGRLKPNDGGASFQKVFRGLRMVTLEGQELSLRCATPADDVTCFAQVADGAIRTEHVYRVEYAEYRGTPIKDAKVLLRVIDANGKELLSPEQVLDFVKSGGHGIATAYLSSSAALFLAGLGFLAVYRRRGRPEEERRRAHPSDHVPGRDAVPPHL